MGGPGSIAAKFGVSSGGWLGGLLSSNTGMALTTLIAAAALGTGIYMSTRSNPAAPAAFSSNRTGVGGYVPSAGRQQVVGSGLDMLKDANKGNMYDSAAAGIFDKDGYDKDGYDSEGYDRNGYDKDGYDRDGYDKNGYDRDGYDRNGKQRTDAPPAGDRNTMAQDMMAKLGGSNANRFSMGGFGNKSDGSKTSSARTGPGVKIQGQSDQRAKLLAMKGSARPVLGKARNVKGVKGKTAWGQSKGVFATQKSYTGGNADAARSTQDKAWEGATADGGAGTGGSGLTEGEPGIMTSPSLDNTSSGGSSSGAVTPEEEEPATPAEASSPKDVSPWKSIVSMVMMLILISAALAVIGAIFIENSTWFWGWGYIIGMTLCIIAAALAAMAMVMSIMLMTKYGQAALGGLYTLGSGLALAAAIVAMTGKPDAAASTWSLWLAAAAGVCSMMGMMVGGK